MREARHVCMFVTVTSSPRVTTGPFLYLHDRHIPGHYLAVLGLILVVSTMVVFLVVRGQAGKRSWGFFLLGVGFMLLETRSNHPIGSVLGSTWVVASLAIASVLSIGLGRKLRRLGDRDHQAVARRRRPGISVGVERLYSCGDLYLRESGSRISLLCSPHV